MYKDIKNYESYGVIDEFGNVKKHNSNKHRKTYKDGRGHVCLMINNKTNRVKNLVAATFIRTWDNKAEEVISLDGDRTNTHYSNLKIVPKSNRYKLKQDEANQIREEAKAGANQCELSRKYKVSRTAIQQILKGKIWNS